MVEEVAVVVLRVKIYATNVLMDIIMYPQILVAYLIMEYVDNVQKDARFVRDLVHVLNVYLDISWKVVLVLIVHKIANNVIILFIVHLVLVDILLHLLENVAIVRHRVNHV
jgi:hypothetical protein